METTAERLALPGLDGCQSAALWRDPLTLAISKPPTTVMPRSGVRSSLASTLANRLALVGRGVLADPMPSGSGARAVDLRIVPRM